MILWAGGITVYLAVLAAMIWLWARCECVLSSQYAVDECATDELMRALAGEEQHRRKRVFWRKVGPIGAAAPR